MEIINGCLDNFDEVTSKGDVLVDFFASWCGPCKMLAPELEEIKDKVQIMKVDIDENLDLCKRFGVMSVPTLIYFKKDGTYDVNIGYMTSDEILKFSTDKGKLETVVILNPYEITNYPNHPFKIEDNEEMDKMVESIKRIGVKEPILVRPKPDGGYEMVAGHRRNYATKKAGLNKMSKYLSPFFICPLLITPSSE